MVIVVMGMIIGPSPLILNFTKKKNHSVKVRRVNSLSHDMKHEQKNET